jgi:hypothetical protein
MLAFMRRLLATSVLALLALCALASAALAATPRPTVTSFSPAQVPIGGTLILKGKNFAKGASKNRVFFVRATDGKTVRARPKSASKTRITLKVPTTLDKFLTVDANGAKKATRFQVYIFTKVFGPKTKRSRSPIVLPAGAAPVPGGGGGTTTPGATAADCDADGTPNTTDNDDDNDLIGDDVEKKIGTDPCKPDTDGDGIEDGFEYYSAIDLNSGALPYPGARPFPNPLDASDATVDFDRDGLNDSEEYQAWVKFGGHALPLNYSAGKSFTDGVTNDGNRDADGDGLSNVTELAKADSDNFNPSRKAATVAGLIQLDWLTADTDGDTIADGADDNDHDGLSNLEEITSGDDGTTTDPEDPASGSTDCDADGTPNSADGDDDNDGMSDTLEKSVNLSQCNKDTDGDGIEDGFEYYSALDLNGNALPYPGSRPYPNALDGSDAGTDFDGDGLKGSEEFAAWNLYGGRVLPAAAGQSFPYSDGNQTSTAPANVGAMDLDGNARITDDEKDADSDGLPNWVELAKTESAYSTSSGCAFVSSTGPAPTHYSNTFTSCDGGVTILPNGNTFGNAIVTGSTVNGTKPPAWLVTQLMNFLVSDTDGDGINDGQDDNDFDGISNLQEITAGTDGFYTEPQDPCDPDVNARACPLHA